MKKSIGYFFGVLLCLLPGMAFAAESVTSFHSTITVQQSAVVDVVEEIKYNFDTEKKHGIIRSIPMYFYTPSGTLVTPIDVIDVTDETGSTYDYVTDEFDDGLDIKIGSAKKTVTGEKIYRIHYTISGVINYFDKHDELYWNVTGDEWNVPIHQASALVQLDRPLAALRTSSTCFQGYTGDTNRCTSMAATLTTSGTSGAVRYTATALDSNQGLTIVYGFPKDIVAVVEKIIEPYESEKLAFFENLQQYTNRPWVFIIPLFVFFYSLVRWMRYGRDPKGNGVIVAQFEAPDKLSPLQVGALIDEKVQPREVSAEIIHLAVLGYLTITRIPKTGIFGSDDYELKKLKDHRGLPEWQATLMKGIFSSKSTITLSSLKYTFTSDYMSVMLEATESLSDKGYFNEDPNSLRFSYYIKGAGLGLVLALPGALLGWMVVIAGMSAGFIYMLMGFAMPKKTKKGVLAREHALGLKLYLSVAEKDRINFHNAPKKDPATFEKFLPYAMVFRVEDVWAEQFTDIYKTEPNWYHDPSQRAFSVSALGSGLHHFSSATNTAMTVSRSTTHSSSGGSGFSGGSSGGGFGGGGGRSW